MHWGQPAGSVAGMDNHHHAAGPGAHSAGGHSAGGPDDAALANLLDLDAEVLHSYLSEVTTWVHDLAAGQPASQPAGQPASPLVGRILDLGSGTGTGALVL